MRVLILISILALASCQLFWNHASFRPNLKGTNKQNLQLVFNGIWEYANLTDPVQAINCFDEPTANTTMIYIGNFLRDVASQNKAKLISDTKTFVSQFPKSTAQCLVNDQEVVELGQGYNITNQDPRQVLEQVIKFITGNLSSVHQLAGTGWFDYHQGMYKPTGSVLGQMLQQVFNSPSSRKFRLTDNDSKTDLQNLFNGLSQDVNLPDPKTAINCFDEQSAHITLDFYGDVINDIATNNYANLVREYNVYKNALPKNVSQCAETNGELDALYDAYGFNSETPATLAEKYAKYYYTHKNDLVATTTKINNDIGNDDYYNSGILTGKLIQTILGTSAKN